MLTVAGSNRSKCMKPELVNCSLCGGFAIQHPSPVWAQRARPAEAAAAPHFNMKVQNVFHIICSFSNASIFIFFFSLWEEVGNAMMEGRRKGGVKKGSRLPGAYLQSVAPRTFQPWNFTAMKLCFCISVGEDVMLTYLCVLIAPLAAWLTDCLTYWWDDYLTICTLNMFSFLTLLLHACTYDPTKTEEVFSKVVVA